MKHNNFNEYIIGIIHDRDIWYYVGERDYSGKKLKPREQYSSFIVDAKHYASRELARADLPLIHETLTRKILLVRKCPICKQSYTDHPALSRKDNKTEICPACGVREAVLSAIEHGAI